MKRLLPLIVFIIFGALAQPVFAEDDKKSEEGAPRNEVLDAAKEFIKDLDKTSARHFSVLHGNYNLIKVVEAVRESVDEAVDACGDANEDMEDALDARFDAWKDAIKPVMKEADSNVKNMILAQDYAKPKEIRKFLKLIDKARKGKDKDVKKVPVVSAEACQSLLEKMDDTQPNMVKLLEATLVSLPQAMQTQDDEKRVKAEAKAKEKAEKTQAKIEAKEAKAKEEEEGEAAVEEDQSKGEE